MSLYLVKLGGSVVTDIRKPNTARPERIDRLARELKRAMQGRQVILGHGSGSFGHVAAHRYRTNLGLIAKDSLIGAAITQDAAAELHRIIMKRLIANGISALSFPLSASCIADNGTIRKWNLEPMMAALEKGFLPVVYGDVVQDRKKGVSIASTEEILEYISRVMRPSKVLIAGDTDGIFDSDPKINRKAKLIKSVGSGNVRSVLSGTTGSTKVDVTGGMHTKLQYLYRMSEKTGATCQIINGCVPGRLYSALSGKSTVSTTIKAR